MARPKKIETAAKKFEVKNIEIPENKKNYNPDKNINSKMIIFSQGMVA